MESSSPMEEAATPCADTFLFRTAISTETSQFNSEGSMEAVALHPDALTVLSASPKAAAISRAEKSSTSFALRTTGFSANCANSCTHTAPLINRTFEKKKLSVRRNGSRNEKSSRSRQLKFCERRHDLFKKARELSVLCSAEVGAIIFPPSGKVSEFASSSMSHILKRYQSCQPQIPSNNVLLRDAERLKHEAIVLNSALKGLQEFESMTLSINEAQSYELMLTHALDMIRKRKMKLLEMETQKIVQKGEFLCKETNVLKEKLIQIMSTKECVSNALSGWEDSVSTNLHGLDILQRTQEENSYSSKC